MAQYTVYGNNFTPLDSSEGAWATISRHLKVVADNVPLSFSC
jgi:hypothetical protein